MLNDFPAWAGVTVMMLADAVVIALMRAYDQRQMQRLLRAERKLLEASVDLRVEQLAEAKFTDMMIEEKLRRGR